MSRKDYERWLADGPGALSLKRVSAALTWRDTNPVEARTLEACHREVRREAQDRESLRAVWIAKGGDELAFEREWPKLKQENEAARLRELDRGAREAFTRHMRSTF
jgi:hypothetical protein